MKVTRDILARIKWPLLLTLWSFIAPIGLQQVEIGLVTFKLGKDKKQRKEKTKEAFIWTWGEICKLRAHLSPKELFSKVLATVISVIIDNTSSLGFWMFCHSGVLYFEKESPKMWSKNFSCKEALHVLLRLDRKLGKCNTKYGRYVYCTAAAWSEYFPEKFPRISQHLAENSRGPLSGLHCC